MPPEIKPRIDKGGGSRYEMVFPEMNSKIYCDLESRGDTINDLHCSEVAFMQKDRLLATLQTVPLDGRITLETTANGLDPTFYDLWNSDTDYEKLFYPWFLHDEYAIQTKKLRLTDDEQELCNINNVKWKMRITHDQIAFRRMKQKELGSLFLQEYPEDDITCFLLSGRPVCDLNLIRKLAENSTAKIRTKDDIDIFSESKTSGDYVIGADPSQGIGGDYSVATVFCIREMKEVAFMRGQWSPYEFAHKLENLANLYSRGVKQPLIAVESNNHGHAVLQELVEHIKYGNLFYTKKDRPGWITDSISRPIMVNQAIEAVQNERVRLNSKTTLMEMSTLVNKNGKIQAVDGKHDDAFIATAIAIQMVLQHAHKIKLYENIGSHILV